MIRALDLRGLWHRPVGPAAEYYRAAALGGFFLGALAFGLPGASPQTVAIAVVFYSCAAAIGGWLLRRDYPHGSLGLCNYVTLGRLVLVASLVAPAITGSGPSWAVFAVAAIALSLDGVDGWLARYQSRVSRFGARFDMEVDSVLALVLALNIAIGSGFGLAAILLGLPRYAFGVAGLFLPWIRRDLPQRFSRKAVCVLQLGTLIALQAPVLPASLAGLLVPLASGALVWSFAVDVFWLWRRRG